HVTFVERDRRAQTLVAENLARCGVADGYVIIRASIERALEHRHADSFDIMLLDPPYDHDAGAIVATAGDRLTKDGIVVLEHARRRPAPETAGRLVRVRAVNSGDSALAFYSCPL